MTRSYAILRVRISDGQINVSGSGLVKTPLMKRRLMRTLSLSRAEGHPVGRLSIADGYSRLWSDKNRPPSVNSAVVISNLETAGRDHCLGSLRR